MNYLSLSFYIFIPLFFIVYYSVAAKYRYIVIVIGSFFFYGYGNVKLLIFLLFITLVTYIGGIILEKRKNKIAYIAFFSSVILILVAFKYTNFIIENLNIF